MAEHDLDKSFTITSDEENMAGGTHDDGDELPVVSLSAAERAPLAGGGVDVVGSIGVVISLEHLVVY